MGCGWGRSGVKGKVAAGRMFRMKAGEVEIQAGSGRSQSHKAESLEAKGGFKGTLGETRLQERRACGWRTVTT